MSWGSNLPDSICTSSAFGPFVGHSCSPVWFYIVGLVFLGGYAGYLLREILGHWYDR